MANRMTLQDTARFGMPHLPLPSLGQGACDLRESPTIADLT
jgi:hypothetical protein